MKTCFFIAPIGEEGSDTRRRSDQTLNYIVRPILDAEEIEVVRADEMPDPGLVTSQIIQKIVDDDLVVADLTDANPNVFYELAIRHGVGKPFIQLIEKGQKIPFDVAGVRTIPVVLDDLDGHAATKKEFEAQVKSILDGKNPVSSPISASFDLASLSQSGDPEQRTIGDIMKAVHDLKNITLNIDERIHRNSYKSRSPSVKSLNLMLRTSDKIYSIAKDGLAEFPTISDDEFDEEMALKAAGVSAEANYSSVNVGRLKEVLIDISTHARRLSSRLGKYHLK